MINVACCFAVRDDYVMMSWVQQVLLMDKWKFEHTYPLNAAFYNNFNVNIDTICSV